MNLAELPLHTPALMSASKWRPTPHRLLGALAPDLPTPLHLALTPLPPACLLLSSGSRLQAGCLATNPPASQLTWPSSWPRQSHKVSMVRVLGFSLSNRVPEGPRTGPGSHHTACRGRITTQDAAPRQARASADSSPLSSPASSHLSPALIPNPSRKVPPAPKPPQAWRDTGQIYRVDTGSRRGAGVQHGIKTPYQSAWVRVPTLLLIQLPVEAHPDR